MVVDADLVVAECLASDTPFAAFGSEELIAPDVMPWEAASTLHEYQWRLEAGHPTPSMPELTLADAQSALAVLHHAPVRIVPTGSELLDEAWRIADRCGFARLYDAAYVALALREGATLITLDAALRRGPASRLITILGPSEIV